MKNHKNGGFSLVELLIVFGIIMVIASIAVPNLLASRRSANEASALQSLRTMSSSQVVYFTTYGNNNYGTAAQLYNRRLIDITVAAASSVNVGGNPATGTPKGGYVFRIQRVLENPATGTRATFVISANPSIVSGTIQTGTKRMCLTEVGPLKASYQNLSTKYTYNQCGSAPTYVP